MCSRNVILICIVVHSDPSKDIKCCLIKNQTCTSTTGKTRDWRQRKTTHRFILSKAFQNPSEILYKPPINFPAGPAIHSQLTPCRGCMESGMAKNYMVILEIVDGQDESSLNHKWTFYLPWEERNYGYMLQLIHSSK